MSAAASAPDSAEGDGVPGAEQLDGVQSPSLAVEKLAPPEIQVGKEATFKSTSAMSVKWPPTR